MGSKPIPPQLAREIEWQLSHPYAGVAWRAERAVHLATHVPQPLPARSADDAYTRSYRRVLRDHLEEVDDLAALERNSRDLRLSLAWQAHLLHIARKPAERYLIKARLLAGQSDQQIAALSGLGPKTIEFYEALFFDVRRHLEAPGWIQSSALKPAQLWARSPSARAIDQRGFLWMTVGYYGKADALEWLIDEKTVKLNNMTTTDWLNECTQRQILIAALTGALLFEPNTRDLKRLVAAARSRREAASPTGSSVSDEQLEKICEAVERGLPPVHKPSPAKPA